MALFFLIIALCFSFSLSTWGHSASFSIIITTVLLCLVRMLLHCLLLIHPIRLDWNGVAGHNKEQTKAITSKVSLAALSLSLSLFSCKKRGVSRLIKRKGWVIIKLIVILVTREEMNECRVASKGYIQFEASLGCQGSEVTYYWGVACVSRFKYKEDLLHFFTAFPSF